MIDLITANEFTFTPSAFIAAYIEQEDKSTVTETTANGGQLDTVPKQPENIHGEELSPWGPATGNIKFVGVSGTVTAGGITLSNPNVDNDVNNNYDNGISYYTARVDGILGRQQNLNFSPVTASGSLVELIGQQVADTRTTNKTVVTAKGADNTVVLVLSYGQFRAKCADAQATVTLIHTRVAEYLNSLV